MSDPTRITFPGLHGVRSAMVERPSKGRRAVVVVGEPGEAGGERVAAVRAALTAGGFVAASLEPPEDTGVAALPHVEDVAALLGTLFVSSSGKVGLLALGRAAAVVTPAIEGLADVVAAYVVVGHEAPTGNLTVPVVQLNASAEPADITSAVGASLAT